MSASVMSDSMQINFNPSWMQSSAPIRGDRLHRESNPPDINSDSQQEMVEPVFAKHRYGREDLLALMAKDPPPPEGLDKCPFYLEKAQTPIILQPLTETEQRLQQNINSSKALSTTRPTERHYLNGTTEIQPGSPGGGGGGAAAGGWTVAGPRGNSAYKPATSNRWSALATNGGGEAGGGYPRATRGGAQSGFSRSGFVQGPNRPRGLSTRQRGISASEEGIESPQTPGTNGGPPAWQAVLKQEPPANVWRPVGGQPSDPLRTLSKDPLERDEEPSFLNTLAEQRKEQAETLDPGKSFGSSLNRMISVPNAANPSSLDPATQLLFGRQVSDTGLISQSSQPQKPPPAERPSSANSECSEWYYVDPHGKQQGPFATQQMQAWFANGYFSSTLKLRKAIDTNLNSLGELIAQNGAITPFVTKAVGSPKRSAATDVRQPSPNSQTLSHAQISDSVLNPSSFASAAAAATSRVENLVAAEINIEQLLRDKEQKIAEEQKKLKEKEEALRREEKEREEKERRMREMEAELSRRQEQLQKLALEKQREIEDRQRQVEEFERQKREALERYQEQLRAEIIQQQRQKEEDDRRRQQLDELARQEQEKQRLALEAETKRLRQEDEAKIQRAYEEARRIQDEAIQAKRKREEEEKAREEREKELKAMKAREATAEKKLRKQQEKVAEQQREQKELLRQQKETERLIHQAESELSSSPPGGFERSSKAAPWVTVAKTAKKDKLPKGEQKSLQEIQEEEERIMREQMRREQDLMQEKRKQQPPGDMSPGVWGAQKLTWGSGSSTPISDSAQKKAAAYGGATAWNVVPSAAPVPIPKDPPKQQKQPAKPKKASKVLVKSETKEPDAFTSWIIKRVRSLNATVDADVFATFLSGVESPNEAEDYIIGYFGDTKASKEFHRDFLIKRIELRPRVQPTEKDDLSGPALAADTSGNLPNASGNGGKKKKKGKTGKVIDGAVLGFKTAGDPNRLNVGEIDNTPPVPVRKR